MQKKLENTLLQKYCFQSSDLLTLIRLSPSVGWPLVSSGVTPNLKGRKVYSVQFTPKLGHNQNHIHKPMGDILQVL